jgi:hypothetical protein
VSLVITVPLNSASCGHVIIVHVQHYRVERLKGHGPADRESRLNSNIISTMTTRDEYELNCLIEGEEDTIIVSVPSAAKVKELKQVIYREGELDASPYRLLDLILWKVGQEFLYHQCGPSPV